MAKTGSWAWGLIISYLSKSSPNKSITIIQYTHQGGGLFALLNLWCHVTDPYCPEHIYPNVTDRMTKIMTPVDIWYPTKIIIILWTCTVFYFNFLFPFFFISFIVDKSLLWEEKVNQSYSMLLYSSSAASLFTNHHERQLYIGPRKSLGSWENGPRVNVTYLFIVMTSSDKMDAVWSWISHNINEKK